MTIPIPTRAVIAPPPMVATNRYIHLQRRSLYRPDAKSEPVSPPDHAAHDRHSQRRPCCLTRQPLTAQSNYTGLERRRVSLMQKEVHQESHARGQHCYSQGGGQIEIETTDALGYKGSLGISYRSGPPVIHPNRCPDHQSSPRKGRKISHLERPLDNMVAAVRKEPECDPRGDIEIQLPENRPMARTAAPPQCGGRTSSEGPTVVVRQLSERVRFASLVVSPRITGSPSSSSRRLISTVITPLASSMSAMNEIE